MVVPFPIGVQSKAAIIETRLFKKNEPVEMRDDEARALLALEKPVDKDGRPQQVNFVKYEEPAKIDAEAVVAAIESVKRGPGRPKKEVSA